MPQSFADEFKSIPMSPGLAQSLERAHRFASEQGHRQVSLEHLLLAFTEDPEATVILQAANVDLMRLTADVSGYLGRLTEEARVSGAAEPRPDPELLRVLQAAASAAQQSRRRQIDGAIVLAAMVGDGRSPAAGLLKALGMTFEEAIRALQRANTQARAKVAPPKPAPPVSPADAPPSPGSSVPSPATVLADANFETGLRKGDAGPMPAAIAQPPSPVGDEYLAAARARIQKRASAGPEPGEFVEDGLTTQSAGTDASPEEQVPKIAPAAPADAVAEGSDARALTADLQPPVAGEASLKPSNSDVAPVGSQPPADSPSTVGEPAWTPRAEPRPAVSADTAAKPSAGVSARVPPRGPQPGEGPQRPPLPVRPAPAGYAPGAAPNRPVPRAPWPEGADRGGPAGRPVSNGSLPQDVAFGLPSPRIAGAPGERGGPLIESVPRRMRANAQSLAEVRISREKIDALIVALSGRGAASTRPDAFVMRALSVRLRAPNGGFWIEPLSPETVWVERSPALIHDEFAIWRWAVMPNKRGSRRLLLTVSVRTIGHDGLASETAPPDRVIDVGVRGNYARAAGRLIFWGGAIFAGAVLGRYSDEIWATSLLAFRKLMVAVGG
jgi:hypothetical protein